MLFCLALAMMQDPASGRVQAALAVLLFVSGSVDETSAAISCQQRYKRSEAVSRCQQRTTIIRYVA